MAAEVGDGFPISQTLGLVAPYQYRRLVGSRDIRLIRFLEADTPTCTFIQINLDKSPPYVALSYTWGAGFPKHVIHIDGQELIVSGNLFAALKILQHSLGLRYLWVDAICINQTDLAERSHQVGLMNAIYRSADRVIVWLGPEADDSDFAIQTIRTWGKEIPSRAFDNEKPYWEKVASIKPSDPTFCGPPGTPAHRAWLAIRTLWERSWWRRAWIVQEAALSAPQRLELLCGNQSIYWDDFAVSIDIAQYLGKHNGFQAFENWQQSFPTRLYSFRVDRESGYYLRLLRVLEHMRSYECSDDRDKVFAALGMAANVSLDDITPDYQTSVEDVYTDVVRFALGASEFHCFDFLGYLVQPEGLDPASRMWARHKDLPTWVCTFSAFFPLCLNISSRSRAFKVRLSQCSASSETFKYSY
jgi:Heterokaryon incompatibility protein (HET)